MVGNWVPIGNDSQRLQNQLRGAINQLAQAAATLASLSALMSQMAPSTDCTTIETYFVVSAGNGQTLKDVVGTANTALQGSNIQGLLQRFG